MTFELWMFFVDMELIDKTGGLDSGDLEDFLYYEHFCEGTIPTVVAAKVLEREKELYPESGAVHV